MDKYILGGGISGLLYAYYNRDFTIISPDLGGKLNNKFFENIVYLHATDSTEQFLKDIDLKYEKKTQLIKYIKDHKVVKELTVEDKVSFIRKKLNDDSYNPKDFNLSTSDYYISVFEIDYSRLLEKLVSEIKYINDSVVKISDREIITESTRYTYSNLVSTINSKYFWSMYSDDRCHDLKSEDITFVLADVIPDVLKNVKFDLCYFIDRDNAITRISKRRRDQENCYLYEFSGVLDQNRCLEFLPENSKIIEYYVEKDGLIFTDKNNIPPKNVLFAGRFATWNHSDKQQDVINISRMSFDLQNMWNIQKRFTSNFVDFNNLNSNIERERFTKDYFVALSIELSEVMNEINYKQHKHNKQICRDKIVEEMIDVFKYYLNMLLMWDISPKEFFNMFVAKSDKVSNLYNMNKNGDK